jgi:hypothetical protein
MDIGMNGPLDDGVGGWIGRRVTEWKKNMFKLPDTANKIMHDGQSEELDKSDERNLHQVRHIII